jgi:hypothetical protein
VEAVACAGISHGTNGLGPGDASPAGNRVIVDPHCDEHGFLDISERRVRQIAQDGKIEGVRTEDGWKLFRYSVHDFRDHRAVQPPTRGAAREEPLEGRLELTERAESTMREERERLLEDLARERERAAQKQESAEEAREEAELFVNER